MSTPASLEQLILEVKEEILTRWISEDGLGRLDIVVDYADPRAPATRQSVRNANGILHTAYMMAMLDNVDAFNFVDRTMCLAAIRQLQLRSDGSYIEGLTSRWPAGDFQLDSHDNSAAIFALFELCETQELANRFLAYYEKHWGILNNVKPGALNKEAWRQPGEFVLYRMVARKHPKLYQLIWFLIGATLSLKSNRTYSKNLLWIRLYGIKKAMECKRFWFWTRWPLQWMLKHYAKKVTDARYMESYFIQPDRPVHPIAKIAKFCMSLELKNK